MTVQINIVKINAIFLLGFMNMNVEEEEEAPKKSRTSATAFAITRKAPSQTSRKLATK